MPIPSREQAAADAAEEISAYALIRAWMADDADTGMLMIKQQRILAAWTGRQQENARRAAAGLPPKTRRRRRNTMADLVAAPP